MTDIQHVFSCNPTFLAVNPFLKVPERSNCSELRFIPRVGGMCEIGARQEGFHFDNETPRHRDLDLQAPVSHVSYYESDAFARWAEARLPTEAEWETHADEIELKGNFQESGYWHPVAENAITEVFF